MSRKARYRYISANLHKRFRAEIASPRFQYFQMSGIGEVIDKFLLRWGVCSKTWDTYNFDEARKRIDSEDRPAVVDKEAEHKEMEEGIRQRLNELVVAIERGDHQYEWDKTYHMDCKRLREALQKTYQTNPTVATFLRLSTPEQPYDTYALELEVYEDSCNVQISHFRNKR